MLGGLSGAREIVSTKSIKIGERNIPSRQRSLLAPPLPEVREGCGIEMGIAMTC